MTKIEIEITEGTLAQIERIKALQKQLGHRETSTSEIIMAGIATFWIWKEEQATK